MALPNAYNRLDYVESSGTQYFNLSTLNPNALGRVECAFTFASSVSTYASCLLGSSSSSNNARIIRRYNGANSGWNFQVSNVTASGTSATNILTPNTRYEFDVDFNNGYGKINDTIIYNFTGYPSSSSSFRNLYLLADNDSDGVSWKARGKLEYFKAYDRSGNTIMNLIPAIRKNDSVVGMYDDINDVFYTNAGSGNFTYGNILYNISAEANPYGSGTITGTGYYTRGTSVSLEAIPNTGYGFVDWQLKGYTRLDYIESTGTQFIDTEVLYSNDLIEVEVDLSSTGTPGGYKTLLGMYTSSSNGTPFSIWTSVGFGQNFRDDVSGTNYPYAFDGTRQTFTFTNNRRTGSAYNIYLFKANVKGGNVYDGLSELKIFSAKIKVNSNVVRDYIPVIRHSDSAIGLLDLVNFKFYGNSGTGTFIGGEIYAS